MTACAVQDALGGDVVHTFARLPDGRQVSHYFNRVAGAEVDFTRDQFPEGTLFGAGIPRHGQESSTRSYVLSHASTRTRYERLRARMREHEDGGAP